MDSAAWLTTFNGKTKYGTASKVDSLIALLYWYAAKLQQDVLTGATKKVYSVVISLKGLEGRSI